MKYKVWEEQFGPEEGLEYEASGPDDAAKEYALACIDDCPEELNVIVSLGTKRWEVTIEIDWEPILFSHANALPDEAPSE